MHWFGHTCLRCLHHLILLPSASTRTNLYSVCAQGWQPWQYLVRSACQGRRATCDAAPRAKSISKIHSSSSLKGPEARAAKSEKSRWQCSSRSCLGSVCRKHSIVPRIVSWAAAVRPSFTSRWTVAFLYAHCAWVICRSGHMSPWAQKSTNCIRFACWICCALRSTQSAHSWPSRKQSQPRQSWYRASTPSLEFGLSNEVSVRIPFASRYCLNSCTTLPSICWSYSHWTSCSTKSLQSMSVLGHGTKWCGTLTCHDTYNLDIHSEPICLCMTAVGWSPENVIHVMLPRRGTSSGTISLHAPCPPSR